MFISSSSVPCPGVGRGGGVIVQPDNNGTRYAHWKELAPTSLLVAYGLYFGSDSVELCRQCFLVARCDCVLWCTIVVACGTKVLVSPLQGDDGCHEVE